MTKKFGVIVREGHERQFWIHSTHETLRTAEDTRKTLEACLLGAKVEVCDWSHEEAKRE